MTIAMVKGTIRKAMVTIAMMATVPWQAVVAHLEPVAPVTAHRDEHAGGEAGWRPRKLHPPNQPCAIRRYQLGDGQVAHGVRCTCSHRRMTVHRVVTAGVVVTPPTMTTTS